MMAQGLSELAQQDVALASLDTVDVCSVPVEIAQKFAKLSNLSDIVNFHIMKGSELYVLFIADALIYTSLQNCSSEKKCYDFIFVGKSNYFSIYVRVHIN